MNKVLIILAMFAFIANANFFESTMATTGTEYSLSTLETAQQYGNNTYLTFDSTSGSDTQNITVRYMTSTYDQKTLTYPLSGTTASQTDGLNYMYLLKNASVATEYSANATSSDANPAYWNVALTNQPQRLAVHTLYVTDTGNNNDDLLVWLNGVNVGNVTHHSGSVKTTISDVNLLKGNNNVTVTREGNHNFTETKTNTTAKTGGSGTQTITFTTNPTAGESNITINAEIPDQSGVESEVNDTLITITARVIGEQVVTNDTQIANGEYSMVTLTHDGVEGDPVYKYNYLSVYVENLTGEVLVSLNGNYVGALAHDNETIWSRNQSVPAEAFLNGANNISFSGTGTADIVNVTLQLYYIATPASIDGNHSITLTKAGTGNLTVFTSKTGACEISISLNDVWVGNLTGLTESGVWEKDFVVGVNNVTYGYDDVNCHDSTIDNSTIDNAWDETFTVSLNGVLLGTITSSPHTWTGQTVVQGVNNVSYTSSDTLGNLTNSSISVVYNAPPTVTLVNVSSKYFNQTLAVTFTMPSTANNWTFTSSSPNCTANYSSVYHMVGTALAYTTDAVITSSADSANTDDGTTATLNDVTVANIYLDNNTYPTELWYRDGSGNRVIVAPYKLALCKNATLTNNISTSDITATQYTRSGTKTAAVNDIAYVFNVKLSSAAAGSVTVNDAAGQTLFTIGAGNTTPIDNGASKMCISATGCTVTNLWYGGDALWKMTARVFAHDGTNRTALAVFQAAGTGDYGTGTIRYGAGERLVFYGLPYTDNTNVSLNYEAN